MTGMTLEGPPIDVEKTLDGQALLVIGCTGFLGKVWLSLLLNRYPNVGRLYVMVRERKNMDAETRFWTEIAPSPAFDPIREQHGTGFEAFMRGKITPVGGDVSHENLGITQRDLDAMKADRAAIVNIAGVVDFNPPLHEALQVNAFGAQNLVAVARYLGDAPILHTSTCYVVGRRDGLILERNPLDFPFPRADELDVSHWNAENEIAECVDVVEHTRRRVEDAPRQSHLLDEAKQNLKRKQEPLRGKALEEELSKVKDRFVKDRLVEAGKERAEFWGWPNIYTYTKSIGEQVLLKSGLKVAIARPAIVESAVEYPKIGWCEGIQTSTPIMYLCMQGLQNVPMGEHCYFDIIPVDMVSAGMIAVLAALLNDRHEPVYQMSSADKNPLKVKRAGELIGLSKRVRYKNKSDGNQWINMLQGHAEPAMVPLDRYNRISAPAWTAGAKRVAGALRQVRGTPLAPVTEPLRKQAEGVAKQYATINMIIGAFVPFITKYEYRFSSRNTRGVHAMLTERDQKKLPWSPQTIDWRDYWLNIHTKGFEEWAEPLLEEKLQRETKALRRHETLVAMVEDLSERHEHALAFQQLQGEGLTRFTYRDVEQISGAIARRIADLGLGKGDRVVLGAKNQPLWPITYFGILRAGCTVVPVDAEYEAEPLGNVIRASKAKLCILGEKVVRPHEVIDQLGVEVVDLVEFGRADATLKAPAVQIDDTDLASLIYTSGTTGEPKGVMLTHENFTALVAALAPLFPLKRSDRLLSVLPLHHTFEFTCGMLLPFTRGARVIYLDEVVGDRVVKGLELGKVTSMVGVPALWQLLERRVIGEVKERGPIAENLFHWMLDVNRSLGRHVGVDLGKLMFGPVHGELGGSLRTLISGGSALPRDVHDTFAGLGLHLAEGYGLTEAAPVLTVAKAGPKARGGNVGKAIPGVELKIIEPNADGVGEVAARGPNVMKGYVDNDEATAQVLEDGWLKTGDLGKMDEKGRLTIVGRSKDVIVTATGENVYPDDVENLLGVPKYIKELSIIGLPDGDGNERVACLGVIDAEADDKLSHADLLQSARDALQKRIANLPRAMRPTNLHLTDVALPRTSTRKVKRKEVVKFVSRLEKAKEAIHDAHGVASDVVRNAIASVAKRKPEEIKLEHHLSNDLGFDSLMVAELATALDPHIPHASADDISQLETVGDIQKLMRGAKQRPTLQSRSSSIEKDEEQDIWIPKAVRDFGRPLLGATRNRLYDTAMRVKVRGKGNIPHNRNTLVVANHASHLDQGLIRYALGSYGEQMIALAAQDYFFSDKWRRAYFENFTHTAPLDRRSGLRKALRQCADQLDAGRTVLIFPEGTRSKDGVMQDFMPMIGALSLNHDVDILPLYLKGTHKALPKGAKFPRNRQLEARIGPPLRVERLRQEVEGMKRADTYRKVARIAQDAVEALRDGGQLDLDRGSAEEAKASASRGSQTNAVKGIMAELESRFVRGAVDKRTSFYFSIGDSPDGKWTLRFDADGAEFHPGRPDGGKADCVLKTSEDIFSKIVRESYTPSVAEFMAGKVKSNDIQLLQVFQKAFDL